MVFSHWLRAGRVLMTPTIGKSWSGIASFRHSTRDFTSSSGPLFKALENWERPKIEEIGIPEEKWEEYDSRHQKKYNRHLVAGLAFFGFTCAVGIWTDTFSHLGTPALAHQTGYSTKYKSSTETESLPVSNSSVSNDDNGSSNARVSEVPITTVNKDATPDVPEQVPYLLVGGGTASFAAYRAIRTKDPRAKILIVGEENRLPYMRPPLSKELWYSERSEPEFEGDIRFTQWNGRSRSLFFEPNAFYPSYKDLLGSDKGGVSILSGRKVVKIDASKQTARLDNGKVIKYHRCLLATGGKPKKLPVLDRNALVRSKVSTFRSVDDFFRLEELTDHVKNIAIIGGGFLGSELACALGNKCKNRDTKVYQIFRESGNMGKVLPEYLSKWTTEKVEKEGVKVLSSTEIANARVTDKGKLLMTFNNGQKLEVDHAVVAVGIEPNTELAENSRLELDESRSGFRVNAELEARSNLWAAGDAASFYDVVLGRRRVEHHDHAVVSGRLAGENMSSPPEERKAYTHQSMFWADLGPDVGYEAIGLVDSQLDTVAIFAKASDEDTPKAAVAKSDEAERSKSEEENIESEEVVLKSSPTEVPDTNAEKYGKGVIFYLKDQVVVGIVLWNAFGRMSLARRVIRENKKYEDLSDLARLFNLHSSPDN